jgi:hypothetical protein
MNLIREPNAEPLPGYRLIEPLGCGGFGEVWKCEAPGGLFKAIKFVYGNLNALDVAGVRAEQEFNALNRIKEVRHPFILSTERIEVCEGELVIVMELADKSLHDVFEECQAAGLVGIPRDDLLRYIRDAAEALDHMNEKHSLQHLDIKPRNLFLVSDRVKVADFGLVKDLERQTAMVGGVTPLYAAPETFEGKVSGHSDQYSLAIVYQEMLTGKRPFDGKNARQLMVQHLREEPELRALPEAERPVMAQALAKDPANRFPNCLAFVRALYTARVAPKAVAVTAEPPASAANGSRPKTMAETLENFLLEQMPADDVTPGPEAAGAVADAHAEVSQLGLTMHLPDTGVLRPTLVIGLGGFGRRALLDLRCRFLDRFGDLARMPLQHFLYIDPDPEAARAAVRGAPELAYNPQEVYHLALQPVGNYRRRMLEHLNEWLPREKLYALPRALQTQGSRALGRLAFVDNHHRLAARLKRELEQITHPDALYQSVSQTGLALRDNLPRVYVIAAAGGGSSGLLVDLGYALRQTLQRLNHTGAEVTALVFCGAPEDPATPREEQANIYAALTELNHFADPAIPFAAQYGVDGPRTVDQGPPFQRVYLLKLAHRGAETLSEAVAHLGSYLFHELTTPLGLRLERNRLKAPAEDTTGFRSFGTYAVWFPRGLLLRLAAEQACGKLLAEWQAAEEPTSQAELEAACARAVADRGLRFEAVCARIEEAASGEEGSPAATLTSVLSHLEEQSQQGLALDEPGGWARQAVCRLEECVGVQGTSVHDSSWRKSKLNRALGRAAQKLAAEWERRLAEVAWGQMEHPGRRVSAAEAAIVRLIRFCEEATGRHQGRVEQLTQQTRQAGEQLASAVAACRACGGGFSFFGGRARRVLRVFMDHLAAFARQRLSEEVTAAGLLFYATLRGRLEERQRELAFCRQRLRHLQEGLEAGCTPAANGVAVGTGDKELSSLYVPLASTESYWEMLRHSNTVRLVLPEGEERLDRAASDFVRQLTPEQWMQLDQALQDRVLGPSGGLYRLCVTSSDLLRGLAGQLVPQAAACLGELLPVTDVAQVELSAAAARQADVAAQAASYHARAVPLVAGADGAAQQAFLLVPASDAGRTLGDEARGAIADLELVRVPGQADLMFCREQGYLTPADVQRELGACRRAYQEAMAVPASSPHSRFDIVDWVPLDP